MLFCSPKNSKLAQARPFKIKPLNFQLVMIAFPLMFAFYRRAKNYLHNSFWIIGERIFALGLVFVATIFVARYLGPDLCGSLAYAISLTALSGVAGHLGLHGLVVREIVKEPSLRGQTLETTAVLKFIALATGYLMIIECHDDLQRAQEPGLQHR
ncbi:hypothetical protein [Desulfobulbus alkaliphilus]|uniref:hypothetical protein n=1 Tax=Desulfobulbus alkaliphilus TaxID=869814 RepID=UPI00196321A1|nr:hypothetical protein [Desulfobulbus alkaliphilus]MBM9537373.1 hypothetical protein [Desulfobulbus alkaliphilus]